MGRWLFGWACRLCKRQIIDFPVIIEKSNVSGNRIIVNFRLNLLINNLDTLVTSVALFEAVKFASKALRIPIASWASPAHERTILRF
jgi:hypothetical protein